MTSVHPTMVTKTSIATPAVIDNNCIFDRAKKCRTDMNLLHSKGLQKAAKGFDTCKMVASKMISA